PPVLGWAAITGTVSAESLALFLIIFIWTPPHFWALAIERHAEYAEVDIPMLPVTHGLDFTRTQVLLYTILLFLVSLLPFILRMSGVLYLAGAVVFSGWFLVYAIRLKYWPKPGLAMRTFAYSIVYLMAIFTLLLFDHYLQAIVICSGRRVGCDQIVKRADCVQQLLPSRGSGQTMLGHGADVTAFR